MGIINRTRGRCLSVFFQDRATPGKGEKLWFHAANISHVCSQVSLEEGWFLQMLLESFLL